MPGNGYPRLSEPLVLPLLNAIAARDHLSGTEPSFVPSVVVRKAHAEYAEFERLFSEVSAKRRNFDGLLPRGIALTHDWARTAQSAERLGIHLRHIRQCSDINWRESSEIWALLGRTVGSSSSSVELVGLPHGWNARNTDLALELSTLTSETTFKLDEGELSNDEVTYRLSLVMTYAQALLGGIGRRMPSLEDSHAERLVLPTRLPFVAAKAFSVFLRRGQTPADAIYSNYDTALGRNTALYVGASTAAVIRDQSVSKAIALSDALLRFTQLRLTEDHDTLLTLYPEGGLDYLQDQDADLHVLVKETHAIVEDRAMFAEMTRDFFIT